MIIGAHSIIYSKSPEEDRTFLRDALGLPHVDVGDGWLIFGLPPSEVAIHPSTRNDIHEFYFMCEDVEALVAALSERKIACGPVQNAGWGLLTQITLPGGGRIGVYEPRHARPPAATAANKSGGRAPRAKAKSNTKAKPKPKKRRKEAKRRKPTRAR